jgi:ABC-2 type transport system permease protein
VSAALLRSEVVKILTIRGLLWIALANLGLLLITAFSVSASGGTINSASDDRGLAQMAAVSVLFALIGGIVIMAGEATHGTITQTLLVTPLRPRVLAAKALVAAAVGFVLAVVSEVLMLAITVPGASLDVDNAQPVLVGVVIAAPLAGALGVGLGAVVHGQGASIAISLIWLLVGENLSTLVLEDGAKYTPGRTFAALTSGDRTGDELLGMVQGGVVTVAWTCAFLVAGVLALVGRDV